MTDAPGAALDLRSTAAIVNFVGLPRERVERLIAAGILPAVRDGVHWLSSRQAIDRAMARCLGAGDAA